MLIKEVYSAADFTTRPPEWPQYHSHFHASLHQLVNIANRVKPKLLILYHQLPWGTTPGEMLAEIAETYNCNVAHGNDLEVY